MDKYAINHSTLVSIGDAIREKEGSTEEILVSDLADRIKALRTGGYELPSKALVVTGNCDYKFYNNQWNWVVETIGEDIICDDINSAENLFYYSGELECIPFDLVFTQTKPETAECHKSDNMFHRCYELKEIKGKIVNFTPNTINRMFNMCWNLRYLPEFENFSCYYVAIYSGSYNEAMFSSCYSLREIPESFLKQIRTTPSTAEGTSDRIARCYSNYNMMFYDCSTLDEIKGLYPESANTLKKVNVFNDTFTGCHRVKNIMFATQEDGKPYIVSWNNQVINLADSENPVGYTGEAVSNREKMTGYNSGIPVGKVVNSDDAYNALKNDPDWWARGIDYSRYNRTSAVNTINTLPDTAPFSGINTIRFRGKAGAKTDGGAINTMTAEEIAVAAAKGWTVSFV